MKGKKSDKLYLTGEFSNDTACHRIIHTKKI